MYVAFDGIYIEDLEHHYRMDGISSLHIRRRKEMRRFSVGMFTVLILAFVVLANSAPMGQTTAADAKKIKKSS